MDSTKSPTQFHTVEEIDEMPFSKVEEANTNNAKVANDVTQKKSSFPLHRRLESWLIRTTARANNHRTDTVYIHVYTDIQFRSMNEVDEFIQLGLHPKRPSKKINMDPEIDQGLHGSNSANKRLPRRKLNWSFHGASVLDDGITPVYDIKFQDPGHIMNQDLQVGHKDF